MCDVRVVCKATRAAIVLIASMVIVGGCSRAKYRLAADREAYTTIAERNCDPRWNATDFDIELDPRSRYFDSYDPDCAPMPQDDPAAHMYMHCVDGKKGWKHWHDNGVRAGLENPVWRERLGEYVEFDETGAIKLDIESAIKLAYIHSPNLQFQLETLYLSALDVTTERFRLDAQFFGGYDVAYRHDGSLVPASLTFDAVNQRYVINPPFDGVESNRVTLGRPSSANPALQYSRRFANAGQLLAGFANSFVFEFTGPDAGLSASLLNFTFLQPLLQGAGKDIALEQLTFAERSLLANLRAYGQFRQGFYTQIAVGELGVSGPQRGGRSTSLQIFSGQGGVNGYVGLLQQVQQIRNSEDNLALQERTLEQLVFREAKGEIDLVQVDQFRQSVETERASLLLARNNYERQLDIYKTSFLGLPPDLEIALDDSLIRQFQLIDREATAIQNTIAKLIERKGAIESEDENALEQIRAEAIALVPALKDQVDVAVSDIEKMRLAVPVRKKLMDEEQLKVFESDLDQLDDELLRVRQQYSLLEKEVAMATARKDTPEDELAGPESRQLEVPPSPKRIKESDLKLAEDSDTVVQDLIPPPASRYDSLSNETNKLLAEMRRVAEAATLAQARARLESVAVTKINIPPDVAFQIALENRLDFMNGRTALVDNWRLIQVNADALQSVLNFNASGDIRTARNNPVSFRAPTSNLSMGVQFDAPLTRLVERNSYREALISYQRARRSLIQSHDALHLDLRVLLRQIEQLRANLEIQRRAVLIAIRRVDLTRAALIAPVRPPAPGQRTAQFGPTSAFNLLSAQSALRSTQNAFLGAWLSYYAANMRLHRELGIMQLDVEGRWIESDLPDFGNDEPARLGEAQGGELPPPVPEDLLEVVNSLPEDFQFKVKEDQPTLQLEPAEELIPFGGIRAASKAIPWLKK